MLALLISAFGLGVAFCTPPGSVNTETVRRGLLRGYPAAVRLQLGSLVGDAGWAVLGLSGAGLLIQQRMISGALLCLSTVLLGYLSFCAWRDAWQGRHVLVEQDGGGSVSKGRAGDFVTGVLLSMGSPTSLVYWLALGGSLAALGIATPSLRDYGVFLSGFMLGCLLWCVVFSAAVAWGRRYLNRTLFRLINAGCGLLLGLGAIAVAKASVETLLPQF